MYLRFFCTIWLLSLIGSCSDQDEWLGTREVRNGVEYLQNPGIGLWNGSKELVLTQEIVLGDESYEKDARLKSIYDLDVDTSGNIYICDYKANKIKIYNKAGKFISCFECCENNLNKLQRPALIEVNSNDRLIVYESGREEIAVFTKQGRFLHSFNPESGAIQSMEMDDSSHVYLSALELNIHRNKKSENTLERCVRKYGMQGHLIQQFSKKFLIKNHPKLMNPYSVNYLTLLNNGNLLCALHYPYILRIYSPSGQLERVISKKFKNISEPAIVRIPMAPIELHILMTQTNIIATHELPDGKILVHIIDKGSAHINDFRAHFKTRLTHRNLEDQNPSITHYYELFDENGRFLQTFTVDSLNAGIIKLVDKEGKIFTSLYNQKSNTYRLTRYRYSFRNKGADASNERLFRKL